MNHEGLTVLRKLQQQEGWLGIKSSSGMVISHLSADGRERRDTGSLLGYTFHWVLGGPGALGHLVSLAGLELMK